MMASMVGCDDCLTTKPLSGPSPDRFIRKLGVLSKLHKLANICIVMNPVTNPYSPGAGSPPRELAGRDKIREQVRVAIERHKLGNPAKSVLMVGLRGVGKTVLLDQMRNDAEGSGTH